MYFPKASCHSSFLLLKNKSMTVQKIKKKKSPVNPVNSLHICRKKKKQFYITVGINIQPDCSVH